MIHVHYRKSWQTGGNCIIASGLVFLGLLLLSLRQYILDKDFAGIILLSIISLVLIAGGIFVKVWAKKKGKE
ncbi:MAG: hypothetical protein IJ147_05895 [Lachnospiraceae bacterium]|nr:hypothetical protein [Lachnospiraceae bacterium]